MELEKYQVAVRLYADSARKEYLTTETVEVEYVPGFIGPQAYCRVKAVRLTSAKYEGSAEVQGFDIDACVPA